MADSVAAETRPRGRADTRRLAWSIALAALLHLPLTPVAALFGLLSWVHAPTQVPPPDALNAIPVSLLSPEEMEQLGMGEPATKTTTPAESAPPKPSDAEPVAEIGEPVPKPKPKPPKPKPKPKAVAVVPDGGLPESPDGGVVRHDQKPLVVSDGGVTSPSTEPAKPGAADPMALVGKAASVADPNANVKLLLLNERISRARDRAADRSTLGGAAAVEKLLRTDRARPDSRHRSPLCCGAAVSSLGGRRCCPRISGAPRDDAASYRDHRQA